MKKKIKSIFERILNLINVHPDTNQKYILMSLFVSGLLMTYCGPIFTKTVITLLPAEWIAFESLFSSISGLLIGMAWQGNIRLKIINNFLLFVIAECTAGFLTASYLCFIQFNVWVYAVATLIYGSLVCTMVSKCIMAFKPKLWTEKGREIYDNNSSIVSGIYCILGFSAALLFMPTLKTALFLWAICCIIDDIGWIIVYTKNKKILIEDKAV